MSAPAIFFMLNRSCHVCTFYCNIHSLIVLIGKLCWNNIGAPFAYFNSSRHWVKQVVETVLRYCDPWWHHDDIINQAPILQKILQTKVIFWLKHGWGVCSLGDTVGNPVIRRLLVWSVFCVSGHLVWMLDRNSSVVKKSEWDIFMSNQRQNMITLQLHLKMQNLGLIQFNLVNYILKNHHFAVTVKKKSSQNPKNVGSMFSSAVKLETCSLLKLTLLGHLRLLCCFTLAIIASCLNMT